MPTGADYIASYLTASGIGTEPNQGSTGPSWATYSKVDPSVNGNIISILDGQAVKDGRGMQSGVTNLKPLVQIRVRALDYSEGASKCQEIQNALDSLKATTVTTDRGGSGVIEISCFCTTSPWLPLGVEERQNRHNFLLTGYFSFNGG